MTKEHRFVTKGNEKNEVAESGASFDGGVMAEQHKFTTPSSKFFSVTQSQAH